MAVNSKTSTSMWKQYLFEFLSIFIGITLAFALQKWNDYRVDRYSEMEILTEMKVGLELDLKDVNDNQTGHRMGIKSCDYFRGVVDNKPFNKDSLYHAYYTLWRDFISVQNKSGYETLKSKGLELIRNDSLSFGIIKLYDFYYEILEKLEENYSENQFNKVYFHPMNDLLSEYYVFNENGGLVDIRQPIKLTKKEKNLFYSYLFRIKNNRKFMLRMYDMVEKELVKMIARIDEELENRQ